MQILNVNDGNTNFGHLRIKIKGAEFKKHAEDAQLIKSWIKNDVNITDFFKKHNGKIIVEVSEVKVPVTYDYPRVLRKVPSSTRVLPIDQFTVEKSVPNIDITCTYNRGFSLRNLFRKPVWIKAGTVPNEDADWKWCMDAAKKLITRLGKDTPEDMASRGDTLARDLASVEARRLKVERP